MEPRRHCSLPWTPLLPAHWSHWVDPFTISQHGWHIPTRAAPLTTTLDLHHGAETQKEIVLAAPAVCTMDSVSELWTWTFSSKPSAPAVFQTVCSRATTQDAPASCVGFGAFGAAGRLPAVSGDGANGRSSIRLWSDRLPKASVLSLRLQLFPLNSEIGILHEGGGTR